MVPHPYKGLIKLKTAQVKNIHNFIKISKRSQKYSYEKTKNGKDFCVIWMVIKHNDIIANIQWSQMYSDEEDTVKDSVHKTSSLPLKVRTNIRKWNSPKFRYFILNIYLKQIPSFPFFLPFNIVFQHEFSEQYLHGIFLCALMLPICRSSFLSASRAHVTFVPIVFILTRAWPARYRW